MPTAGAQEPARLAPDRDPRHPLRGKMRSMPKLIPGVHHKLPGDAQDTSSGSTSTPRSDQRVELNLYISGEEDDEDDAEPPEPTPAGRDERRARRRDELT